METIDITPTWEQILPMYIAVIREGSKDGVKIATDELLRMARLADEYNAEIKARFSRET